MSARILIFQMSISSDKTFLSVPAFLTLELTCVFRAVTSLFGTEFRVPMSWEYYQHFGENGKITHLLNEEQS